MTEENQNQDLNRILGQQESIKLADNNKYMLNELNLDDLGKIAKISKEETNYTDVLVEQLFLMIRKAHPSMTRDVLKTLVTASMLNPKNPNSILKVLNQLSGAFGEDSDSKNV